MAEAYPWQEALWQQLAGRTQHAHAYLLHGPQGIGKRALAERNFQTERRLMNYESLSPAAAMAVPTPDHYWPFLYALGAADAGQVPRHVFEAFHSGTLSMRCLQFG